MSSIDITPLLTPDGRWNLLQDWLDEHPRHKAIFEMWLEQTPEEVFPQVRAVVAEIAEKKYGPLAGALVKTTQLTPEIGRWIAELKTLYADRQSLDKPHERPVAAKSEKRSRPDPGR
jgi:hypothetical protein